jgi:hypothetical protein
MGPTLKSVPTGFIYACVPPRFNRARQSLTSLPEPRRGFCPPARGYGGWRGVTPGCRRVSPSTPKVLCLCAPRPAGGKDLITPRSSASYARLEGSERILCSVWRSSGIPGTLAIQNIQNPFALVARAAKRNPEHQPYHLPRPCHFQLPARSDHLWFEHDKTANLFQSLNECDVLTSIQAL